jgi:hypothetical protein
MRTNDLQKLLSSAEQDLNIEIVSDQFQEVVYTVQSVNLNNGSLKIAVKPTLTYAREKDSGVEL